MPQLHCDSQSAIQLAKNQVFHTKTKQFDVKYHFTQKMIEDKKLIKVNKKENLVDLLTKNLPQESLVHCHELMGVG